MGADVESDRVIGLVQSHELCRNLCVGVPRRMQDRGVFGARQIDAALLGCRGGGHR